MLNTFPRLLDLGFFAPTLLRLAVALMLAWSAMHAWRNRRAHPHMPLPMLYNQPWIPALAAVVELLLAAMFFCGWHTQIAALIGIAGVIKYAVYRRWWPEALAVYFPLSPGAAFFMFFICLSLLISGAGAFAFDLPL